MPYSGNPTVKSFKTDMLKFREILAVDLETNYLNRADELIANMKGAVPADSGTLKNSIRKKNVTRRDQASKRVSILVMAGGPMTTHRSGTGEIYDYALGVEFGTVDTKAEPFFYSSARLYRQAGVASARETVDQAIAKNNRVRELRALNYNNASGSRSVGGAGGATVL